MSQPNEMHPTEQFLRKNNLYTGKSPTMSGLLRCISCRFLREADGPPTFTIPEILPCVKTSASTAGLLVDHLEDLGVIAQTGQNNSTKIYGLSNAHPLAKGFSASLREPETCPLEAPSEP